MCELYKLISKFCNVWGNDGLHLCLIIYRCFRTYFNHASAKTKMINFIKNQKNEK